MTNYYPYIGGSEEAFRRITEGLASKGHAVYVVTTLIKNTSKFELLNGVHIHRIDIPRFAYQFLFNLFSLFPILQQAKNCDVIHTSSNYGALVAWVAGLLSKKPVVFTCHEVLGKRWFLAEKNLKAFLFQAIEYIVIQLPYDWCVAVSEPTQKDLEKSRIKNGKVSTIYWGLDQLFSQNKFIADGRLRKQCGISEKEYLYVYFGRPGATKGVEYLVYAVPEILSAIPDSHLALILASEPRVRYQRICKLIKKLGIEKNVHLITPFPDRVELAKNLIDADCIVIPSLTEGFGLTTVESCELKVPVVATSVGPIPKLIYGKYVLIPSASSKAIAEGVERAWKGQFEVRKKPQELSWNRTILLYQNVYRGII